MPLKILGAALISFSGFSIGCMYVQRLKLRRDFLREFSVFLSSLSTAVRYRSADIAVLVNSCGELFSLPENDYSRPFSQMWQSSIADFKKRRCLSNADMALLKEFGEGLGTTDVEGQLNHIALYQGLFSKQQSGAEDDIIQKSKLYKSLGLFGGVSAALMFL